MIVLDCRYCGCLHPVNFDMYAGIDGDDVADCQVADRLELSRELNTRLREIVSVTQEEA